MSCARKINGKNISLWVICFIFLVPLAVNVGHWSGKPIDMVLSDIWLLLFLCGGLASLLFTDRKVEWPGRLAFLAFLPIVYFFLVGLYGGMTGGGLSNILSMMRFVKQFAFLIVGWALYKIYGHTLPSYFIRAGLAVLLVVVFSSVYYGDFPMGCGVEGRWGGCLFSLDAYGFPNSAASYYVFLLGLLMCGASKFSKYRPHIIIGIPIVSVMIVLTLSRAAWVYLIWVAFFGWLFLIGSSKKFLALLLALCMLGVMAFAFVHYEDTELGFNALGKIERNVSADPSSGRFVIWKESIELIKDKPLFGYGFSYFSNYVRGFGTPHNQYLEILFKAGVVGLLIYISCLVLLWSFIKKRRCDFGPGGADFLCWGVLGGLVVNGLFQPIFSYSIVANILMTGLGYVAAAAEDKRSNGAHDVLEVEEKMNFRSNEPGFVDSLKLIPNDSVVDANDLRK